MGQSSKTKPQIAPPKGTRDLYPQDALRRRYITQMWRDAAIRCGFDEIEGPTLESSDLYSIKSGEGILSELFQVYSGKSDKDIEQVRETGRAPYAMRPEFTPTLARMYASRAKQLPKPCKWFTAGPYFRAERPQRGRLREFLQWNVDAIGLPSDEDTPEARARMDAETIECCVRLFEALGVSPSSVKVLTSDRHMHESIARNEIGISSDAELENYFAWLDGVSKRTPEQNVQALAKLSLPENTHDLLDALNKRSAEFMSKHMNDGPGMAKALGISYERIQNHIALFGPLAQHLCVFNPVNDSWCIPFQMQVVRGLAYYTGTVFEAIADGERAVAGGGRYDKLIELMGGPPTPAVGFAMGDVVLANLLDDHGLFPEGPELMDAVSRQGANVRPDAFVVPNGDEDNEPLAAQLASSLRRGVESEKWLASDTRKPWDATRYSVAPLHARVTYKSTRNLKKLRADAEKQHARYFVEIHGPDKVECSDMDAREPLTSEKGSFDLDPASPHYVGRAIAARS